MGHEIESGWFRKRELSCVYDVTALFSRVESVLFIRKEKKVLIMGVVCGEVWTDLLLKCLFT